MSKIPDRGSGVSPVLLSLVVPCYNEEAVIQITNDRIVSSLGELENCSLEIIYVDDGSSDSTLPILTELAQRDPRICVVALSRNFGHQPAVNAGLHEAKGDVVAVIDADLQDPPELIVDMLSRWREGYQVVYGVRRKRKEGVAKRIAYSLFYRVYRKLADVNMPLDAGDFALLDRQVVDVMNALPETNRFLRGLRAWSGFRQTGLVYERHARAAGETKYPFMKLVQTAADGIFSFSTKPLTMVLMVGLLVSTISFVVLVLVVLMRVFDIEIAGQSYRDVPGLASVILSILLLGGIQLAAIGIVGEYIGRIYAEVKRRPNYVVGQVITARGGRLSSRDLDLRESEIDAAR